jgi:hypothetical protein
MAPAPLSSTTSATYVVWKIVHHHADKAPSLEAAYEKLATEG